MRKIVRLLPLAILFMLMIACASTQPVAGNSTDRDGSTVEKAIPVKSVGAEYDWIKKTYPGSQVTQQALINKGKKHYDLLTFTTSSGETKQVYFDISSFFGKGF
jgi:hypothetical protein